MKSIKASVFGLVQGVGFRPFVYKLATQMGLKGEVFNDSEGVKIYLECGEDDIKLFFKRLFDELPPLAKIEQIKTEISKRKFSDFKIAASKNSVKSSPILPDFAICDECKREFYDENSPRFLYPFINCTNCGPRFSIISALPYDRKNTTMHKFKMCKFCQDEYTSPLNRRYHAEPISCQKCGVSLILRDNDLCFDQEAILKTANFLKEGKIVAIKGLGGFHLVCDGTNDKAIAELRRRKKRPKKPFALMCEDLEMAQKFAQISGKEMEVLTSHVKPIVILKLKQPSSLASQLCLNLDKVGIFLANTGVHLSLFNHITFPIIATSANISSEPIIYDYDMLKEKLSGIFDLALDNDREILNPSDDSVAQIAAGEVMYLRTSRGKNPQILRSNFAIKGTFLALGAELKNQFAIYKDGEIFLSPYIGDIKNVATFERFLDLLKMFIDTYELEFDQIIGDLHPHFLHTRHFEKLGFDVIKIQHHYAHALSVIFENALLDEDVLAFCFDGTGLGDDGSIWGGEVLSIFKDGFKRVACFDEFKIVGGDEGIKNIQNAALSAMIKYSLKDEKFFAKFSESYLANFKKIYDKSVATSSLGRIFDAFGSVILGLEKISYEAEVGMELEALYDENLDVSYEFELDEGKIKFDKAFLSALSDEPKFAATAFINGIGDTVLKIAKIHGKKVVLCGGVFQNRALVDRIDRLFSRENLKFYIPKDIPTNDSGIALGQLIAYLRSN